MSLHETIIKNRRKKNYQFHLNKCHTTSLVWLEGRWKISEFSVLYHNTERHYFSVVYKLKNFNSVFSDQWVHPTDIENFNRWFHAFPEATSVFLQAAISKVSQIK